MLPFYKTQIGNVASSQRMLSLNITVCCQENAEVSCLSFKGGTAAFEIILQLLYDGILNSRPIPDLLTTFYYNDFTPIISND